MRAAVLGAALLAALGLQAQPTSGDAGNGKVLFEGRGSCLGCHTLNGKGGTIGPELSEIGIHRSADTLDLALRDPSAEIFPDYVTTVIKDRSGHTLEGLTLNEDDLSIQLRDSAGELHSLLKDDILNVHRELRSLMPSYAQRFTAAELRDVVAYLRTLRGRVPVGLVNYKRKLPAGPVAQDLDFLDRIDRAADERPDSLMDALKIQPGSAVADIGSGTGYFTWRLAQKAGPNGSVTAVDLQTDMLERTKSAFEQHKSQGSASVQFVLGRENDPMLAASSMDLIFVANSYHEFAKPEAMLRALHRALRANGRLVIVEYAEEAHTAEVDEASRMSLAELRQEIEPLGFDLDYVLGFLPMQHGLIFRKRF